jgi:hypothetical protein
MDQRAALHAREDALVDGLGVLLLAEYEAAARTAQRLVRGRGHGIGVRDRRRMQLGCDQPGDVGHVDHEARAHFGGDPGEVLEVDDARVGAGARHDELRPVFLRQVADLVVVDALVVLAHAVGDHVVEHTAEVDRRAVRQMAAVREVHAEDRVTRLEQGEVDAHVRLGAGVRLHVGVVGAEQLAGAGPGRLLHDIGELATAVVALAGVALGVLVGEHRAHRLEHGRRNEVLAAS